MTLRKQCTVTCHRHLGWSAIFTGNVVWTLIMGKAHSTCHLSLLPSLLFFSPLSPLSSLLFPFPFHISFLPSISPLSPFLILLNFIFWPLICDWFANLWHQSFYYHIKRRTWTPWPSIQPDMSSLVCFSLNAKQIFVWRMLKISYNLVV